MDLRWQLASGEDVVAFLVETLALRLRAIPARSLAELAADVVDATGAALQTPLPFDAVVDELRARGELPPTGTPLHVYVNWLDGGQSRHLAAGGPSVTYVDEPMHDAKFELSWTVVSRGSELTLRLEHDSSRRDRPSAERLLDRALHVLDLATADASRPLGQLGLLLPDEAERIFELGGHSGPRPGHGPADLRAGRPGRRAGPHPGGHCLRLRRPRSARQRDRPDRGGPDHDGRAAR